MRKEQIQKEAGFPLTMPVLEGAKTTANRVEARALANVYCPLCTRTVQAMAMAETNNVYRKSVLRVIPGQKCPRCSASLDAGYVLGTPGSNN